MKYKEEEKPNSGMEFDLATSLKRQVNEQIEDSDDKFVHTNASKEGDISIKRRAMARKRKKKKKARKRLLFVVTCLLIIILAIIGTKPGRKLLYKGASGYVYSNIEYDEETIIEEEKEVIGRDEEYVTNYLIFGIEEIGGAKNTDSMMIASINTMDDTIKITSLMRDTYVSIPGYKKTKLNAAYPKGGVSLLIQTIEENYKINIDGYASVNFESFEQVIDRLGGIEIELGAKEAAYLRKTNYISEEKNRKVTEGVNLLNGNQALGYSRVRKVETLGGVNNDYGRTLRQRRVIDAIFKTFKSKSIVTQMDIVGDCLQFVKTNMTRTELERMMEAVVENKITTISMFRVPVDGMYSDPKSYEGVTYPLVLDWEANIKELYKFVYGDSEVQASEAYATQP